MNKKRIFIIIGVIIVVFIIFQVAFKGEETSLNLAEVVKGEVVQEVSETGQVQKGDKISLGFKSSGRIDKVYVEIGEMVDAGERLVKLDTTELAIQLAEAKSSLAVYQAQLDKLLAGATPEEIKVYQTKVENKQIALESAEQDLEDTYEDALNTIEDSYLKGYNAQTTVVTIKDTYFKAADQEGLTVADKRQKIELAVTNIKSSLDYAKGDQTNANVDSALTTTKEELASISEALRVVRETCDTPNYRNAVSPTDKTSLDTQRTNISTAITNITNAQQTITSAKTDVDSAEVALQQSEDELALAAAPPRQEDINLYQAQVNQAQAKVDSLEHQIQEAYLTAPLAGEITEINKEVGEIVQGALQESVITLLPSVEYKIDVDIYEEDIIKVYIGNLVDISLVAFPDKIFSGKVIAIEPAEKIVDGVVYYETTVSFDDIPEGIKPGMTADLVIKTAEKKNILVVPEDALQTKDGKTVVEVLEGEEVKEKEIEIGLKGDNDMVEVVSGLEEGEQVIIR